MSRKFHHQKNPFIVFAMLCMIALSPAAAQAGLFGPLQTVSRASGGVNTAIGYMYHEDTFTHGAEHVIKQNRIYSQAAYGANNIWEIYARVGLADLQILDIFSSRDASTTTDKNNFDENWKIFGSLGAKAFYPISKFIGAGVFVQGTYFFKDFNDEVAGVHGGTPFRGELDVQNLWEINCGMGLQATLPSGVRLYAGPYVYYSEAKFILAPGISGLEYAAGNTSVENKSFTGGFFGLDIPLLKGFRFNIEGQFSEKFSAGAAISFTY